MSEAPAPQILIADDDEGMREIMCDILSDCGVIVTAVENGAKAAALASQQHFDACVLDIEMPIMNGLQACSHICASSFTKDLPILILTGRNDQKTIDDAFEAGAWDFLNKPVHGLLLWRRLSNMLTLSKLAKEAKTLESMIQLSNPTPSEATPS